MSHDENDGIRELDNPIPGWFRALFYATVVFGFGYFGYYVVGEGPGQVREYEKARLADELAGYERRAAPGARAPSEERLQELARDETRKASGRAVFAAKCASCHGGQGQGGIGPNLADAYWLHGGRMADVLNTITRGVPDKGMPPWGPVLGQDELVSLTVFIRSLRGTRPPGAKAPQGTEL